MTIAFSIPSRSAILLRVYDVAGRTVRTLADDVRDAGEASILWDGKRDDGIPAPSGVYFYELRVGGERAERRLVILR
jgi:flagellar hook assembly protein FlgD